MPDDYPNILLKEKLVEVISEAGLQQMQRDPTRGQNILDLFCCNTHSLVKAYISIRGISDHCIVLVDSDLKVTINKKPSRKVYQCSKADWQLVKEQIVFLLISVFSINQDGKRKLSSFYQRTFNQNFQILGITFHG